MSYIEVETGIFSPYALLFSDKSSSQNENHAHIVKNISNNIITYLVILNSPLS